MAFLKKFVGVSLPKSFLSDFPVKFDFQSKCISLTFTKWAFYPTPISGLSAMIALFMLTFLMLLCRCWWWWSWLWSCFYLLWWSLSPPFMPLLSCASSSSVVARPETFQVVYFIVGAHKWSRPHAQNTFKSFWAKNVGLWSDTSAIVFLENSVIVIV